MNSEAGSGFFPNMLVGYSCKSGRIYLVRITKKMMYLCKDLSFLNSLILANSIRLNFGIQLKKDMFKHFFK